MQPGQWGGHAIEMTADRVIKRFPAVERGRAVCEWRALTLLHAHAPGLAPRPWEADLEAAEPTVVMSRLAGVPLRGAALDRERTDALARAVTRIHTAVPSDIVREVPVREGHLGALIVRVRRWGVTVRPQATGVVRQAMDAGLAWLARSGADVRTTGEVPAVFGAGDGNLANYLWDGVRVQVVDFEESGRSDRAFELAEIIEHVGSWVEHPLDVSAFLGHFDLTPAETVRLRECRRLLALVWLFLLTRDAATRPRNPAGTAERQAERLLDRLL
ncbi:phosphotransferase family protein [Streptomyces sp. NPDC056411]|uniref:phosphotransferase family protein n=1 Tax=Streptomyces sp. NPDC056411 TaxID=3345813 RepID=UPI0035DFCC25